MSGDLSSWTLLSSIASRLLFYTQKEGDYWFVQALSTDRTTGYIYTASDPRGTWSEVMSLARGNQFEWLRGITYDGSTYRALALGNDTFGGAVSLREFHTTDPSGSWSTASPTLSITYDFDVFQLVNGDYVINEESPDWSFAYASDPAGTWTRDSETVASNRNTFSTFYDGGTYYQHRGGTVGGESYLYSASALTSTWGSAVTFAEWPTGVGLNNVEHNDGARQMTDGRYAFLSTTSVYVSDSTNPAGAWSKTTLSTLGITGIPKRYWYRDGVWTFLTNNSGTNRVWYLTGTDTPTGTASYATLNSSASDLSYGIWESGGEFITGVGTNDTGYIYGLSGGAYVWPSVPTTGPTFLRQHQSPVRTPSRVRPLQLRQRQRPEIIT